MSISDHYEVYYADKLWNLLPAVYRTLDADQFGGKGPLREIVNRIGAQAATLRRSIDRMWDDQSIETCDDWIIPYLGQLLGTRLVSSLDPRGQRLDVAKTIYYRLRKGTVAVLEEVAADITGWDAKVVEFFRRLGRTRQGLDPQIGLAYAPGDDVSQLQQAEGLAGRLTRTGIGGFADLRNVYGATQAHTAFDEYFHTADMRTGQGRSGWYNIPKLGVFLWRLISFPVGPITPVAVQGCPGWYSFDPTGRNIPLFAAARASNEYADNWVSPVEGQLPTPISQPLLDADLAAGAAASLGLYPRVMSVSSITGPPLDIEPIPASSLTLRPARGRFEYRGPLSGSRFQLIASYHYGFPSEIGAGPYDRRLGAPAISTEGPAVSLVGGGSALATAIPAGGTVTLGDSLTYAGAAAVTVQGQLTLRAANTQRPLIRLPADSPWIITGTAGSCLTLDGIFASGADIILRGSFESVTLRCCTLDPGSAVPGSVFDDVTAVSPPAVSVFDVSVDGRALVPTRVWVEGTVTTLTADRCVLGPIRTRDGGQIETLTVTDSVVQGIRTSDLGPIRPDEVKDPARFERQLQDSQDDPVSALLQSLSPGIGMLLGVEGSPPLAESPPPASALEPLLDYINELLVGPSIYDAKAFQQVQLSAQTQRLLASTKPYEPAPALNRLLLEDAYPLELADAAVALGDGLVNLSRCTILGRAVVHRLEASECILQDLVQVDDTQDGCVRFTAWADGSVLPRKYECVRIPQLAPLFTTTDFGQPGYAQLLPLVDGQILPPEEPSNAPQNTISSGAEDGSEMGAYARDKNPIKQRALLLKFQEFMPAGLVPVVVNVT